MIRRFSVIALGLLAVVAGCGGNSTNSPAPPGPVTWQVQAGASNNNEAVQGLDFYPTTLTINAGDTVQWNFPAGEPHTVTFLAPGQTPPPPTDPSIQKPAGTSPFFGGTFTSSGFKLLGNSYSLTFGKPGTYTFVCLIHPVMKGTITVLPPASGRATTQSAINTQIQTQIAADLAAGTNALSQFPYPSNGTSLVAGIAPGLAAGTPSNSTVLRFLNAPDVNATTVTVHLGGTVTWTNQSNNEPHTVTFGVAGATFPTLSPFSPPMGPTTYDGTQVVNSGVLNSGQSFTLTFTQLGTFTYHCLFHDETENMIGTVNVVP